ncbi:hypothetical protein CFP56_016214 [Quercus suber]|uniref:Uncharacterized protein n=1 Tax=Quercus suber TaxID=58331 RepID=A0AAW0KS15_QUESU
MEPGDPNSQQHDPSDNPNDVVSGEGDDSSAETDLTLSASATPSETNPQTSPPKTTPEAPVSDSQDDSSDPIQEDEPPQNPNPTEPGPTEPGPPAKKRRRGRNSSRSSTEILRSTRTAGRKWRKTSTSKL